MGEILYLIGAVIGVLVVLFIIVPLFFRRIVETNEVHIVQSARKTTSYGKDTGNGNSYYEFPSWVPVLGVTKIVLPVSVFSIKIEDYEAYDLGRLPFVVDITAFFRIMDSNLAIILRILTISLEISFKARSARSSQAACLRTSCRSAPSSEMILLRR